MQDLTQNLDRDVIATTSIGRPEGEDLAILSPLQPQVLTNRPEVLGNVDTILPICGGRILITPQMTQHSAHRTREEWGREWGWVGGKSAFDTNNSQEEV